jgi:hypothetical protein
MNYKQKVRAKNIIDSLRGDFYLQWDGIEVGDGIVFVGRLANGSFAVFSADKIEKTYFNKDGQPSRPERCKACDGTIEERDEGVWHHVQPPLYEHPATLKKR